jgi:hypothetical protein
MRQRTIGPALSGLSEQCVKKPGRVSEDACLSRVHKGVAAMGQDCKYQSDIPILGGKGVKKSTKINYKQKIQLLQFVLFLYVALKVANIALIQSQLPQ